MDLLRGSRSARLGDFGQIILEWHIVYKDHAFHVISNINVLLSKELTLNTLVVILKH